MTDVVPIHPTDGPIHGWFGLTRSSYAVLSRTLMQSMPIEWQERMVACLEEVHDAFRRVPQAQGYEVHAATGHELIELTDEQRTALGYSEDWYDDEEPADLDPAALSEWQNEHELPDAPVYHDPTGNEVDPSHFVQLRCEDPVPHYRHAYIEPAAEYLAARAAAVSAEAERTRVALFSEASSKLRLEVFPAVYEDAGQRAAEGVRRAADVLDRMAVTATSTTTTEEH